MAFWRIKIIAKFKPNQARILIGLLATSGLLPEAILLESALKGFNSIYRRILPLGFCLSIYSQNLIF